jgi:menaquinone-dependent protoporphyrinogen IX oxidase
MKILVAYYSRSGHTRKAATALAGRLGAEITEIKPEGRVNLAFGAVEALMSMTAPVLPCTTDLTGTDALVLATPVWAGNVPPYVTMYLSQLSGCGQKPFYVLLERGRPGSDRPVQFVRQRLEKKGMRFVASAETIEEEVKNGLYEDKVRRFAAVIAGKA